MLTVDLVFAGYCMFATRVGVHGYVHDYYTVSEQTQSRNFEFSTAWVAVEFSLFQYLSFGLSDDFLLKCVFNVISIAFIFLQVYIVMHDSPESQLHIYS